MGTFDPACRRCSLRVLQAGELDERTGKVLQPEVLVKSVVPPEASGDTGPTLLVVGDAPGRAEDAEGRPFVGPTGTRVRALVRKHWRGQVVLDHAVKCAPGKREVLEEHVQACRPLLAATARSAAPDRVLALGEAAVLAVLGRRVNLLNSRRGYAWLEVEGGRRVPVFWALSPRAAAPNRFLWRFLEEDVAWALKAELPPPKHIDALCQLVSTPEESRAAVEVLKGGEGFAFDLEWAGHLFSPGLRVLCLSGHPVGSDDLTWVWDEQALNDPEIFAPLRAALEDPEVPKGGSNVKADQHALVTWAGVRVQGITFDTRLMRKLLEPDATANLEDMQELVGMGGGKDEMALALQQVELRIAKMVANDKKASAQAGFGFGAAVDAAVRLGFDVQKYASNPKAIAYAFVEKKMLHRYNARDSRSTARLERLFSLRLQRSPERLRVWDRVVLPAATAIQRVEEWGVPFDSQASEFFGQMHQRQADEALVRVRKYRADLNLQSPQQIGDLLFRELGLRSPFETDNGQESTSEEALSVIAADHPVVGDILAFRHHQKLADYALDWQANVRGDGRIHPSIHLDGARSGRTSCSNPNLQNIPRADSEDGKRARDCFVAPKGYVLVELDYSQLELRVAAYMSRDKVMSDLFRSGVDFHLGTAKLISMLAWHVAPENVTDAHRTGAKAFNFGLAYGKTDRTLAADLGISEEQAARIRAALFGQFKNFGQWTKDSIAYARTHGGVWTIWEDEQARWRPLWRIADESEEGKWKANTAKNGAINSPIQGTASEFCVSSIAKIVQRILRGEIDAQLVLPIHDSIMLVAPEKTWKDAALAARAEMVSYPWCTVHVPLAVDCKVGTKWGSLEKVKLAA